MPVMTDDGATEAAETGADGGADAEVRDTSAEEVSLETSEEAEAEAEAPEAEVAEAEVAAAASKARRTFNIRQIAVALVIAGLLAATGVLGWMVFQQRQLNEVRDEAQRAAVSYAQVLTSIDSAKVDDNFKQVLDGATGEFKDMYSQSSVELRQLLVENKATAHGVVIESAVQSASKDKAVVLLFVDQSVSNTKLPDPRIDRSRMKMTMEKVDGAWRASKVELP
ncbi:MAG: Mce-associated rane protein [Actinomycetota bacterium]|nr:Mce-associated rane protein [Actinomycetota bacterium]